MNLLNKRYCSHCGTVNPRENKTCAKCGKAISSGIKVTNEENDDEDTEEIVVLKKKTPVKKRKIKYIDEDGNEINNDEVYAGVIPTLSMKDIVIEKPKKLTIGEIKNGASVPAFGGLEPLGDGVEVSSRSYFHQEKLD